MLTKGNDRTHEFLVSGCFCTIRNLTILKCSLYSILQVFLFCLLDFFSLELKLTLLPGTFYSYSVPGLRSTVYRLPSTNRLYS
jgi:hypothetical protein